MNNYSNYHNANFKDKVFRDSNIMLERQLNGLEGIDALVDGISKRIVAQSKYDSEDKMKIIAKTQDFDTGSLFEFSNKKWLCIGIPVDNEISCIGTVQLCNNTLQVNSTSLHCIVTTKSAYLDENRYITIPDGTAQAIVQYNDISKTIKIDDKFTFGNSLYKVNGVDDFSQVANGKGLIILSLQIETATSTTDPIDGGGGW